MPDKSDVTDAPASEMDRAAVIVDEWLDHYGRDVEVDDAGSTLQDVLAVEDEARQDLERRIRAELARVTEERDTALANALTMHDWWVRARDAAERQTETLAAANSESSMDFAAAHQRFEAVQAELSEKSGLLKRQAEEIAARDEVINIAREHLEHRELAYWLRKALARLDAAPPETTT